MYLSLLQIDSGKRAGRLWLANPYRVHQRLLMAYPDGEAGRVLFRIEEDRRPPRVLVQAPVAGDWEHGFRGLDVLAEEPVQKEVALGLQDGQRLRFLLRANPTARRILAPVEEGGEVPSGKRLGLLREEEQRAWLQRKGEAGGFRPLIFEVRSRGLVTCQRGNAGRAQTHLCVDFEGLLEVTDPDRLRESVAAGIGPAKAFGFGLLSLARG